MAGGTKYVDRFMSRLLVRLGIGADITDLVPVGAGALGIVQTKLYPPSAADPVTPAPAEGDRYYNTTAKEWRFFNGTVWLAHGAISRPLTSSKDIPVTAQDGNTISIDFVWGSNITILSVELYTVASPTVTGGAYAYSAVGDVDSAANQLTVAPTYDLLTVLAGAPPATYVSYDVPTSTTPGVLDIDAGQRVRMTFDASTATGLAGAGSGIMATIKYQYR
jgi:hypothetical protein